MLAQGLVQVAAQAAVQAQALVPVRAPTMETQIWVVMTATLPRRYLCCVRV